MKVTRKELIATRKRLAEEMNTYIIEMGDEDIWITWITYGIPDEPNEEDFIFFAENDDQWNDLCKLFGRLTGRR
jgi:hypothetical protein